MLNPEQIERVLNLNDSPLNDTEVLAARESIKERYQQGGQGGISMRGARVEWLTAQLAEREK